jgi:outer membrane lipoprotein SlyB
VDDADGRRDLAASGKGPASAVLRGRLKPMSQMAADPPPGAPFAGGLAIGGQLRPLRVWGLALAAGLIAGFASWLIGESFHGRFAPREVRTSVRLTPGQIQSRRTALDASQALEATVAFSLLGAVLGLALGLAGGCARGSARAALIAAIAGSIFGGAAGAVIPRALLPIYFRVHNPDRDDLILAILIQGGNWSVIGAAAGAAFGIGLGNRGRALRALIGGLLGAIAGVLVYEMVGAFEFPLDGTTDPLSATWGTRLFARLAVTIFASAGAAIGALGPVKGTIEPRAVST